MKKSPSSSLQFSSVLQEHFGAVTLLFLVSHQPCFPECWRLRSQIFPTGPHGNRVMCTVQKRPVRIKCLGKKTDENVLVRNSI